VLNVRAPAESGVYAFVVDGWIRYIGLTQTGLRTRITAKNERARKELDRSSIEGRGTVKVLIATPEASNWHGLPVNTAAGLEAGLIRKMRPEWNMLGVGK
jgi:hypothetical protein